MQQLPPPPPLLLLQLLLLLLLRRPAGSIRCSVTTFTTRHAPGYALTHRHVFHVAYLSDCDNSCVTHVDLVFSYLNRADGVRLDRISVRSDGFAFRSI